VTIAHLKTIIQLTKQLNPIKIYKKNNEDKNHTNEINIGNYTIIITLFATSATEKSKEKKEKKIYKYTSNHDKAIK